jgi:hypothetical protein
MFKLFTLTLILLLCVYIYILDLHEADVNIFQMHLLQLGVNVLRSVSVHIMYP